MQKIQQAVTRDQHGDDAVAAEPRSAEQGAGSLPSAASFGTAELWLRALPSHYRWTKRREHLLLIDASLEVNHAAEKNLLDIYSHLFGLRGKKR